MPKVYYRIQKTKYITDDEYNTFSKIIYNTLNDSRGWLKYPYNYYFIMVNDIQKYPNVINVSFINNKDLVSKFGKSIDCLSCYVPDEHSIYFNLHNWNNGTWEGLFESVGKENGLLRYRQYVINHEFGHALGLNHPRCKENLPTSVMEQNTRGLTFLNKCIKYKQKKTRRYNPWPLKANIYNEEEGDGNNKLNYKKSITGGSSNKIFYYYLILLLIFFFIFFIKIIKKSIAHFSNIVYTFPQIDKNNRFR